MELGQDSVEDGALEALERTATIVGKVTRKTGKNTRSIQKRQSTLHCLIALPMAVLDLLPFLPPVIGAELRGRG